MEIHREMWPGPNTYIEFYARTTRLISSPCTRCHGTGFFKLTLLTSVVEEPCKCKPASTGKGQWILVGRLFTTYHPDGLLDCFVFPAKTEITSRYVRTVEEAEEYVRKLIEQEGLPPANHRHCYPNSRTPKFPP